MEGEGALSLSVACRCTVFARFHRLWLSTPFVAWAAVGFVRPLISRGWLVLGVWPSGSVFNRHSIRVPFCPVRLLGGGIVLPTVGESWPQQRGPGIAAPRVPLSGQGIRPGIGLPLSLLL